MAVTPQPMKDYALGMDNPGGDKGNSFANRIRPALAPKKPAAPPMKMPFGKK